MKLRGFALVELPVVIAIVAVLAAVLMPAPPAPGNRRDASNAPATHASLAWPRR